MSWSPDYDICDTTFLESQNCPFTDEAEDSFRMQHIKLIRSGFAELMVPK
jgi:hypothetical protein